MNSRFSFKAFLLACILSVGSANAADTETKVVVTQTFQSLLYLPLYVAMDAGFFKKQGLDVAKETAGKPQVAVAALISGSAQFSVHGPEHAAIAVSKGAAVQVVSNVVNRSAVWIVAQPDFGYSEPRDFKGQKIVVTAPPATSNSLFIKLLRESGIDPNKDVGLIPVANGTEIGVLLAGQARVGVMSEPGLDQAVSKGMKVIGEFSKVYGPYAFSTVATTKTVSPEVIQKFVNAMEFAMRYIRSNPAGAVEIAKKEFPTLEPKVIEAAVKRMTAEGVYPDSAAISPDAFATAMKIQAYLGYLKQPPAYATVVNPVFAEKAALLK